MISHHKPLLNQLNQPSISINHDHQPSKYQNQNPVPFFHGNLLPPTSVLSQVCGLRNALGALCSQVQRAQRAERRSQGLRRIYHINLYLWMISLLIFDCSIPSDGYLMLRPLKVTVKSRFWLKHVSTCWIFGEAQSPEVSTPQNHDVSYLIISMGINKDPKIQARKRTICLAIWIVGRFPEI